MKRLPPFIILCLGLLTGISAAAGEQQPLVSLEFQLATDVVFRESFKTHRDAVTGRVELDDFHALVTRRLATILATNIGFIRFTTNRAGASHHLRVWIEREPSANPSLVPTSFRLALFRLSDGAGVAQAKEPFRAAEEYTKRVDPFDFDHEIGSRFAARLTLRKRELISECFSKVPIDGTALVFVFNDKIYCSFPFTVGAINARANTVFRLTRDVDLDTSNYFAMATKSMAAVMDILARARLEIPEKYLAGLLAKEHKPGADAMPAPLRELFAEAGVKVKEFKPKGIFVYEYVPPLESLIGDNDPASILNP